VFVGAEKILGPRVDVREIATAAAGNENFFADAVGAFEDGDAAAALTGFDGAEESGGSGTEDECVKFVRCLGQAFAKPRGCQTVFAFVPQVKLTAGEDRENCHRL
jgi:hypothetical protein